MQPGATTRKSTLHVERQNSEISYYADDEDVNRKKYTRRGNIFHTKVCVKNALIISFCSLLSM